MNRKTVEVFHALMKNGWIDRREDHIIWSYADDVEIQEELEEFKAVMGIDLFRAGDRLYMIPTQDNDLFLKNNVDYRRDIKADNTVRTRDLYLMNYLHFKICHINFSLISILFGRKTEIAIYFCKSDLLDLQILLGNLFKTPSKLKFSVRNYSETFAILPFLNIKLLHRKQG